MEEWDRIRLHEYIYIYLFLDASCKWISTVILSVISYEWFMNDIIDNVKLNWFIGWFKNKNDLKIDWLKNN